MLEACARCTPRVPLATSSVVQPMQSEPFDQEAFLRDARSAAVESGDLDAHLNRGRLQKVRTRGLSAGHAGGSSVAPHTPAHMRAVLC